jgi:MYXO-CTERM domain-containing protein
VALLAAGLALSTASPTWAANLVTNGDFETDADLFVTWPGYVANGANPANITGWTGGGGHGINPVAPGGDGDAPFRDNGDNTTSVAFLQGTSFIEQTVTGLIVGEQYIFSADFNARNCCGDPLDVPIGTVSVNGEIVASSTELFPPPGGVIPVGGENPWHDVTLDPFEATVESLTLRIDATPAAGGDTTLLVDNVTLELVPEPSAALLALLGLVGLTRLRPRRQR